MEWFTDRDPESPGLYGIVETSGSEMYPVYTFSFSYWDMERWKTPMDEDYPPYRIKPERWCIIQLGKDYCIKKKQPTKPLRSFEITNSQVTWNIKAEIMQWNPSFECYQFLIDEKAIAQFWNVTSWIEIL